MKKSQRIGRGKSARTVGQIDFIMENLMSALFDILVPVFIAVKFDGLTMEEADELAVKRVGSIYASRKYFSCPECEKVLLVGAKSGYAFTHFKTLYEEFKRHGA